MTLQEEVLPGRRARIAEARLGEADEQPRAGRVAGRLQRLPVRLFSMLRLIADWAARRRAGSPPRRAARAAPRRAPPFHHAAGWPHQDQPAGEREHREPGEPFRQVLARVVRDLVREHDLFRPSVNRPSSSVSQMTIVGSGPARSRRHSRRSSRRSPPRSGAGCRRPPAPARTARGAHELGVVRLLGPGVRYGPVSTSAARCRRTPPRRDPPPLRASRRAPSRRGAPADREKRRSEPAQPPTSHSSTRSRGVVPSLPPHRDEPEWQPDSQTMPSPASRGASRCRSVPPPTAS